MHLPHEEIRQILAGSKTTSTSETLFVEESKNDYADAQPVCFN